MKTEKTPKKQKKMKKVKKTGKSSKIDIKKISSRKSEVKPKSKVRRSKNQKQVEAIRKHQGNDFLQKLELKFTPDEETRELWIKILERSESNRERQLLDEKLGTAFLKTYTRLRREHVNEGYKSTKFDKEPAIASARLCIIYGITPTQLIKFWMENAYKFTSMVFPSLDFLSFPKNVRNAESNINLHSEEVVVKLRQKDDPDVEKSVFDVHPKARKVLKDAGFDLNQIDDRLLRTIEDTVEAKLNGKGRYWPAKYAGIANCLLESGLYTKEFMNSRKR